MKTINVNFNSGLSPPPGFMPETSNRINPDLILKSRQYEKKNEIKPAITCSEMYPGTIHFHLSRLPYQSKA